MKKLLVIMLVTIVTFWLVGCSKTETSSESENGNDTTISENITETNSETVKEEGKEPDGLSSPEEAAQIYFQSIIDGDLETLYRFGSFSQNSNLNEFPNDGKDFIDVNIFINAIAKASEEDEIRNSIKEIMNSNYEIQEIKVGDNMYEDSRGILDCTVYVKIDGWDYLVETYKDDGGWKYDLSMLFDDGYRVKTRSLHRNGFEKITINGVEVSDKYNDEGSYNSFIIPLMTNMEYQTTCVSKKYGELQYTLTDYYTMLKPEISKEKLESISQDFLNLLNSVNKIIEETNGENPKALDEFFSDGTTYTNIFGCNYNKRSMIEDYILNFENLRGKQFDNIKFDLHNSLDYEGEIVKKSFYIGDAIAIMFEVTSNGYDYQKLLIVEETPEGLKIVSV